MLGMVTAVSKLFILLVRHPELVHRYRGAIPCSVLQALELEDDQAIPRGYALRGLPRQA